MLYEIFKSNGINYHLMLSGSTAGVGAVIASVAYDMAVGVVKEKEIFGFGDLWYVLLLQHIFLM
ncbi:MAG: hypothetical protein V8R63_11765 [Thomasclavelia ramosa]